MRVHHAWLSGLLLLIGIPGAEAQHLVWTRQLGGVDAETATSIALGPSGSVYTVGRFFGTADFDPGPGTFGLTSAGSGDAFISKLDGAGGFVWARRLGGAAAGADEAHGVAIDASGNVYTTGIFFGVADFDPGPGTFTLTSAGSADVFIAKLDGAGSLLWAKRLGGAGFDGAEGVGLDAGGNVHTVGSFNGTADFDPGLGAFPLTAAGGAGAFVSKLDGAGNFVWAKQLGGTATDTVVALSVALDASGNICTVGRFHGAADFDPGPGTFILTSVSCGGCTDAFVAKLDGAGNFVWAKQLGGTGMDTVVAESVALDASGHVLTVGSLSGTADFDPGTGTFNLASAGLADAFISKVDSAGSFLWAKRLGGAGQGYATGVAQDAGGNVYTVGQFDDSSDFDPGPGTFMLASAGGSDVFISKLDGAGAFVWAAQFSGAAGFDGPHGVTVDAAANVYTVGHFSGTVDFDPGPATLDLISAGSSDAFVTKVSGNAVEDADADGVSDANDCAPADGELWSVPGEVRDLRLMHNSGSGATSLFWDAPVQPGGTVLHYDAVRSSVASDFTTTWLCVYSDGLGTVADDPDPDPIPAGVAYFYLVRAENACGFGSAGTDSAANDHEVRDCP